MSDFIAEIRPRSRNLCYPSPDGFVAEIRPRSQNTALKSLQAPNAPLDVSDTELENILSERSFSKESITQILEGSVLTLVEKLLTGRVIAQIKGHIRISLLDDSSPIVVGLNKIFLQSPNSTHDCLTDLDEGFNVKIKNRDTSPRLCHARDIAYNTGYSPPDFDREECPSVESSPVKGSPSPPQFLNGYHADTEQPLSSPPHIGYCNLTPSPPVSALPTVVVSEVTSLAQEARTASTKGRDSEGESGYASYEKEDSDSPMEQTDDSSDSDDATLTQKHNAFNAYFCSGFDGKNTLYQPENYQPHQSNDDKHQLDSPHVSVAGHNDMEEEDADLETPLVIDENPEMTSVTPGKIMECVETRESQDDVCCETKAESGHLDVDSSVKIVADCEAKERECLEETEDDSPPGSDYTDTDAPVDLSGDSKLSLGAMSVMPHPQSLVTKHSGGFKCKQCETVLPDASAVSEHAQLQHDVFCCTFCCRTFTAKNNLKRHIRLHTGLRPYKCPQCTQSFARRDDLKGHMLRHDFSKPFRCSVCKKGYTDRACVKNHMAKEHRSRFMHVCPQCGESFDHDEAFTMHKKSHPELQQFSCKTCSFIGNNNLMTQKHSLLHSHKLFSCKPCNAYFADPFDYTNHVRKHKRTSTFTQYVCCFCDLSLSTYDQYVRHEYSHAQGKTHSCKVCKKQFKNKSLLCDHTHSHENSVNEREHQEPDLPEDYDIDKATSISTQANGETECLQTDTIWANRSKTSTVTTSCHTAAQEERDEFHGELLDLSIKKPSSPSYKAAAGDEQVVSGDFLSRQGPIGLTESSRNGRISESFSRRQDQEVSGRVFESYHSEKHNEKTPRFVSNMREYTVPYDLDGHWRHLSEQASPPMKSMENVRHVFVPSVLYPRRSRSTERCQFASSSQAIGQECRNFGSSHSGMYTSRSHLRTNPYSREKMAALAAKFVAVRGPKSLKSFKFGSSHQEANNIEEEGISPPKELSQTSTFISIQQLQDNHLMLAMKEKCRKEYNTARALREKQNNSAYGQLLPMMCRQENGGERSCEDSNSETVLRCRMPTFVVKSEPLLEEEEVDAEMSPARGFKESKSDKLNSASLSKANGKTHTCEICKDLFGSFAELEAHSVDLHKRYLCEHCGKSFTARPNRDRHVRYHTGERPYKCDLCELAFFRGDDLKYHRTTRHPTAQPFVCPRCSASFTWGRDLERHIRHSKCKV